eukprot:CAMPEP_0202957202 /NCGR_PEP_ID=MMETSP1396-20130829/1637_1 /ASSEMBLY_ACC=CAM_ASM_000872 /TAXON_ID= /ORGANISM="Pseudokeronopsis sp., Strain Brazil" /LENGTH=47 /DNA_ID= /DNA_START= /DNA_END= /DNA_ORIENTATION=
MNPYVFDNTYYKEVLRGENGKYLRTSVEQLIFEDADMKAIAEEYAQD